MTTNRNSWSPKEQEVLLKILEKNKQFVLTYSFELAAKKLNRSLSAISQYYYYHKNKIEKQSLNKQFKTLVNSGKYKLTKKGNLFIVEI
jgi:hypothetical protein